MPNALLPRRTDCAPARAVSLLRRGLPGLIVLVVLGGSVRTAQATCGDYLHFDSGTVFGHADSGSHLLPPEGAPQSPTDPPVHRCSGPSCSSGPGVPPGPRPLVELRVMSELAIVVAYARRDDGLPGSRLMSRSDRREWLGGCSIFRPPERG